MNANLAALLYLVAGVLFIFALRGLSLAGDLAPGQSLRHDRHGDRHPHDAGLSARRRRGRLAAAWSLGLAIGGGFGALWRARIEMTAMPQLVAFFHALVGLAAVLVAAGALFAPQAFGIGVPGDIHRPA